MLAKDQLDRIIKLSSAPQRIISLVPSQTELIIDLGAADRLVGITKFCVNPSWLKSEKSIVGGTKQVNIEKVRALAPDLILCNKEENTKEMVQMLETIAPVWISDVTTFGDALELITAFGTMLQADQEALNLRGRIEQLRSDFSDFIRSIPPKKVLYLIWRKPFMAAGQNTFINEMLQLNGWVNVISAERYPEVSDEDLSKAELILLSTEPYPFKETDVRDLESALGIYTKLVDGTYFSWYGSRLEKAFDYFRQLH